MNFIKLKLVEVNLNGLPPTVNQMYRNAGTHIRYKTKKTREYQEYAVKAIKEARRIPCTFTGRVALEVHLHVADKRKWDIDNRLKVLQDCLQMAGVIKDDSQIDSIIADRVDTSDEACTVIAVIGLLERPKFERNEED